MLAERSPDAFTVVFETASTVYLSRERYELLLHELAEAVAEAPLAFISTRHTSGGQDEPFGWKLELMLWPGGGRRVVALAGPHGEWLEWRG